MGCRTSRFFCLGILKDFSMGGEGQKMKGEIKLRGKFCEQQKFQVLKEERGKPELWGDLRF